MKTKCYLILFAIAFFAIFHACKEEDRFAISSSDSTPPSPPTEITYKAFPGAVRLYYKVPENVNVLSVDAEHITEAGRVLRFSASFFTDSLDVFGFVDEKEYTLKVYATNRAGVRSTMIDFPVTPLESALPKLERNIDVKRAVRSFLVDWENELNQVVNVYVDFKFRQQGVTRALTRVFTSSRSMERQAVMGLDLDDNEQVEVKLWIEDLYGNKTTVKDFGSLELLYDYELDKSIWAIPRAGEQKGGFTQVNAYHMEGRMEYLNDGIINAGEEINYIFTNMGNPWTIIIDLGAEYELTRIVTWQRRYAGVLMPDDDGVAPDPDSRVFDKGILYAGTQNVARYELYRFDEDTDSWEYLTTHTIPQPIGLTDLEIISTHNRWGDEAYIHPENPRFSKPTRWFAYRAMNSFDQNYSGTTAQNLSELTIYGRRVQ